MKRTLALSAAATLLAGLLAGCSDDGGGGDSESGSADAASSSEESSGDSGESPGDGGSADSSGGDTSDYCDALEQARDDLGAIQGQAGASFEKAVTTIRSLADQAPDEVAGDWQTLEGAVDEFEKTLQGAGLELSDMEALANNQIPEGVNPQKLQSLAGDLDQLNSEETTKASEAVSQHAQDACGIELGSGGSGGSGGE